MDNIALPIRGGPHRISESRRLELRAERIQRRAEKQTSDENSKKDNKRKDRDEKDTLETDKVRPPKKAKRVRIRQSVGVKKKKQLYTVPKKVIRKENWEGEAEYRRLTGVGGPDECGEANNHRLAEGEVWTDDEVEMIVVRAEGGVARRYESEYYENYVDFPDGERLTFGGVGEDDGDDDDENDDQGSAVEMEL